MAGKIDSMVDIPIEVFNHAGLWVALVQTKYGTMEFLCGEAEEANEHQLQFLNEFLANEGHIDQVRQSVFRLPWLWRPIRFAVNNQGRLGLQFRNRLTGAQEGMYFADEHSEFNKRLD